MHVRVEYERGGRHPAELADLGVGEPATPAARMEIIVNKENTARRWQVRPVRDTTVFVSSETEDGARELAALRLLEVVERPDLLGKADHVYPVHADARGQR